MPELGRQGQERLKTARVLLVGVGGLGCPAALYLTAAGVGRLGLIDPDRVDISNLQRQILYTMSDLGQPKAEAAAGRLRLLNPHVEFDVYSEALTAKNALKIFSDYDLILDGADNFATRFLTNDAAFFSGKTLISASVLGFEGQLSVFAPQRACYRCLYPEPPPAGSVPSCTENGVLGVQPGLMGLLQAQEALKIILNLSEPLQSELLLFNSLALQMDRMKIARSPDCPLCSANAKIRDLQEEHFVCAVDSDIPEVKAGELSTWLNRSGVQILDVRDSSEFSEGRLPFTHHIPLPQIEARAFELAMETPVLVYCRSGGRSLKACTILKSKGFRVFNLAGGIAGVPIVDYR